MMKTYLADEEEALDGFEFLSMAEAGELCHWEIVETMADTIGDAEVLALATWAVGVQREHVEAVRGGVAEARRPWGRAEPTCTFSVLHSFLVASASNGLIGAATALGARRRRPRRLRRRRGARRRARGAGRRVVSRVFLAVRSWHHILPARRCAASGSAGASTTRSASRRAWTAISSTTPTISPVPAPLELLPARRPAQDVRG